MSKFIIIIIIIIQFYSSNTYKYILIIKIGLTKRKKEILSISLSKLSLPLWVTEDATAEVTTQSIPYKLN